VVLPGGQDRKVLTAMFADHRPQHRHRDRVVAPDRDDLPTAMPKFDVK
jgi:hypothetical protein